MQCGCVWHNGGGAHRDRQDQDKCRDDESRKGVRGIGDGREEEAGRRGRASGKERRTEGELETEAPEVDDGSSSFSRTCSSGS